MEINLPNMHFIDGIFLPVEVNLIKDTQNSCCSCKGVSKECDNGGGWIYCDILKILMDNVEFDETGEKDGCNNYQSKQLTNGRPKE